MELSIKSRKSQFRKGGRLVKGKEKPLIESLILCAESHQDTKELLVYLLEMNGYKVVPCETVLCALEFARGRRFDLYLITDTLKDGSGLDLVQKIRLFDKQTPMLFFSTMSFSEKIEELIRTGIQACMIKPYDITELIKTIKTLLKGRSKVQNKNSA